MRNSYVAVLTAVLTSACGPSAGDDAGADAGTDGGAADMPVDFSAPDLPADVGTDEGARIDATSGVDATAGVDAGCPGPCTPAHATGTCATGACGIASCDPGYIDCDHFESTGCELADDESPAHCGRCSTTCDDCVTTALDAWVFFGPAVTSDVPPICAGTTPLCCAGGTATTPCGPLRIDFVRTPGDDPRLVTTPGASESVDVVIRARVTSVAPLPITIAGTDCMLSIDSTATSSGDPYQDVELLAHVTPDYSSGRDRIVMGLPTLNRFTAGDFSLGGSFACTTVSLPAGYLSDAVATALADTLRSALCASCPCGT